ncbi:hypothetical protein D4R87_03030 [bacterium]|nr:MAG: hypothetical protein D4R87_03030 [bacterium]
MKKLLITCIIVFIVCLANSFAFADAGDGVYRDMDRPRYEHWGHAGIDVGNGMIVHMQKSGCCYQKFSSSFANNFWGYITQGNSNDAKQRVQKAFYVISKGTEYSFFRYKSFPKYLRCDGLVEHCFEKAGGNIVWDWGWYSLSPLKQWKSRRIKWKNATPRGTIRALIEVKGNKKVVDEYIDSY